MCSVNIIGIPKYCSPQPPVWKFPGGVSDFAEDIPDAAIREVSEETGITAEFRSILAFRQQHRLRNYFQLSDLYFICRLKPVTYDIHPCQDEVLKCEWMKLDDLAISQVTTPLTHEIAKLLLEAEQKGFSHCDIVMHEIDMNLPDYTSSKSYKLFMRSNRE